MSHEIATALQPDKVRPYLYFKKRRKKSICLIFKHTLEIIPFLFTSKCHDNVDMIICVKILCKLLSAIWICYFYDYGNYIIANITKY